ncbi:hypothetical protein IPF37_03765 [bacterium]|nr:MAG: hypothetical protein IPF37_03765 [bacterium]
MKAIKFLLGLVFVFGVEQCSLSAAADEMFEMDDCGGSLKPDAEQLILDDELANCDDKAEETAPCVYFMITEGSTVRSKCPNGGTFIRPGNEPLYSVDPRTIYKMAVEIGIEPPAASFLKIPVTGLSRENVIVKPWFVFDDHVFLMGVKKKYYREVLRTRFFDYYEKRELLECLRLPELFNIYFDEDFLQFDRAETVSTRAMRYHLKVAKIKENPRYFSCITNYFIYADKYYSQKLVDITGLEPFAWSDPLE